MTLNKKFIDPNTFKAETYFPPNCSDGGYGEPPDENARDGDTAAELITTSLSVHDKQDHIQEPSVKRPSPGAYTPINPPPTDAATICQEATKLVCNDRAKAYGDKLENHKNIAVLWSAYLGISMTARDVALMMVLLKLARTKTGSNRDNYVDMAGYSAIAGELEGTDDTVDDSSDLRTPTVTDTVRIDSPRTKP